MMPEWVYLVTAGWMCAEAGANIMLVGREREPKTPLDGFLSVLSFGWVAFLLFTAVAR